MGVFSMSNRVHRGATIYGHPFIFPFVSLSFKSRFFVLDGRGARLRYSLSDKFRLMGGISYFTDGTPLKLFGDQAPHRNQRDFSLEPWVNLTYALKVIKFHVRYFQDVIEHFGQYGELRVDLGAPPIFSNKRPLMITTLGTSLGFGSTAHSQYLYGPEGAGGVSNLGVGLSFVFPELFTNITPVASVRWSTILGDSNRSGAYVSDKTSNVVFFFILPIKLT